MPNGCAATAPLSARAMTASPTGCWLGLAALDANPDQELIKDEPFFVYLTVADPRFLDLSLDFPAIGPWLATDA
jgi:hypothetical protein